MRALTLYEDTNMYGGAHTINIDMARKAMQEGRDVIVHHNHYDGQRNHCYTYRVTDLQASNGMIFGMDENGEQWFATNSLCEYALTGRISN
jgi:biotin synthase-like enzyme